MLPRPEIEEPAPHDVVQRDCAAMRKVLDLMGHRWSIMTVAVLARGERCFNELLRELEGISKRMLTLTLRNLERDGLIRRIAYPVAAPHVEYALTPRGHSLHDALQGLLDWADQTGTQLIAAREAYDRSVERPSTGDARSQV